MNVLPRIWSETPSRRRARAVMAHLAEAMPVDTLDDIEAKLCLYDAFAELDTWLPLGAVLAPVEPCPGTVVDAYRLLVAAIHEEHTAEEAGQDLTPVTARDRVATGLAAGRLRALLGQDDAEDATSDVTPDVTSDGAAPASVEPDRPQGPR